MKSIGGAISFVSLRRVLETFLPLGHASTAHSVSLALPTEQKVPAAQMRQSDSAVIVIAEFMRLPPGHGSGAAAPSAQ